MNLNDSYALKTQLTHQEGDQKGPLSQYSADAFTAVNTQGNGTETMSVTQQRDNLVRGAQSMNKFYSPLLPKSTVSNMSSSNSYKQARHHRLRNSYNKSFNTGQVNVNNFSLMQAKQMIIDGMPSGSKQMQKKIRKHNRASQETVSQLFANNQSKYLTSVQNAMQ